MARNSVEAKWCETADEFSVLSRLTFVERDKLPDGMRGIVAFIDEVPAGGIWTCDGQPFPELELGITIELDADQAWLFGARVDPNFRGAGVYNRILDFATNQLIVEGKRNILVAVNPDNKASNHVHKRRSKNTIGTVVAARFVRCALCLCFGRTSRDRSMSTNSEDQPIRLSINFDDR